MIHVGWRFSSDKSGNLFRVDLRAFQYTSYIAALILNNFGSERFVIKDLRLGYCIVASFGSKRLSSLFECVTEGTVPNVVKERRKQRDFRPVRPKIAVDALKSNFAFNNPHKPSGVMKNANRVRKASVNRRGENEL